jgi:putative oxidoreductase
MSKEVNSMNVGLLVLRLVVGGLFAGHGAQKLFGWFGGHGPGGTASFFGQVGFAPAFPLAILAGSAELTGGLLLAGGLALPIATLLIVAVMVAAIAAVHWRNGLWVTNNGFEYPLVMATVAFALAAVGPGSWSLDHIVGIDWHGTAWALAAVVAGALGGLASRALAPTRRGGREPVAHSA